MENYVVFLTVLSSSLMISVLASVFLLVKQKTTIDNYKEVIEEYKIYIKGLNGNEKL